MARYQLIPGMCTYINGVAMVVVKVDGEERTGRGEASNAPDAMIRALRQAIGFSRIKVICWEIHPVVWAKISVNGGPVYRGEGDTIEAAYVHALNIRADQFARA